ncbi:MAG: hypothetical protein ABI183_00555 [Polyangiaceae bacterium]
MKPSEHPEFFRFPAPEGRSRESTIALDADCHFFHDGAPVEHDKLAAAMHSWISRHPDDDRFILTNGYDWTYFMVEDAPYVVRSIRVTDDSVMLLLSDGTEEAWDVSNTRIAESGAIYTQIKREKKPGTYEAKFSRHAQLSLAPYLETSSSTNETRGEAAAEPIQISKPLQIRLKNRQFVIPA